MADDKILENESENEELDNIIVLTDENGDEAEFEFLDLVEYEDEEYVVLLPADDESEEVVILRVEPIDEENESYSAVEEQEILDAVFEIFKEKFKDEFNFED